MTIKSLSVVYITASSKSKRDELEVLLAPHSWATGEHGILLTDEAFYECVTNLQGKTTTDLTTFLNDAVSMAKDVGAGDICLNFGIAS